MIRPESFAFTLLLGLLGALPPLAIDISAPTLVVVQSEFLASSSLVVMTITLFMVGFALGQLTAGPLSDRHGRRPLLLAGLLGYTIAAIGCALSGSITTLLACRLLQGVGAGACAVLTFAIIRDVFDGDQARVKRSYIIVVFGVAPMLAPILGALIMSLTGWRFVHLVLSIGGLMLLLAVTFGVAESRPPLAQPSAVRSSYAVVLSDRRFMGLVTVNALSFGCIFAYISGSPSMLMGSLRLSPTGYGEVFACTAAMLTAGSWVSGQCAQRSISPVRLLWIALALGAGSAMVLAIAMLTGTPSLAVIVLVLMANLFARGLTAPNLQHIALEPIREQAGTAAAALGVIQILSGAASSSVVAILLPRLGPAGVGIVMAVLAAASFLLWTSVARRLR